VEERKYKDEELKEHVFNVYSKYYEASSADRRQVYYGQLCELAFKWCRDHLYYEKAEEMGLEIVEAVKRCAGKDKTPEEFLKYLRTSLSNAWKQYNRDRVKEGSLKMARIITEIKNLIRMEESYEGRELTQNEIVDHISRWKGISEKRARIYFESMNRKLIIYSTDDDYKSDIVYSIPSHYSDSQNEAIENNEATIIKDALESILNKYQDKMRAFYRALFTIRCIKNTKNHRILLPILDAEILEISQKSGKIPAQYEIYMKYHPDAEKTTAQANASQMSKKFFTDLDKTIKEKQRE
jgi:hypothetical protein